MDEAQVSKDTAVYVGVDLHRRYSTVVRKDSMGNVLETTRRVNHTPDELAEFVASLDADCRVAVEATGNWYHFYETVEATGAQVALCHPLKTRAIASARIMTDSISADTLADLLRCNLLPKAYVPGMPTRDLREVLRYRAALVMMTTQVRSRLRAVLAKNGLDCPYKDILGPSSRRFLAAAELRDSYRMEVDGLLRLGQHFVAETERVQHHIDLLAEQDERAQLLLTIPGVGPYTALLVLAEIGDISRFPSAGHLASYAGLVPSVHASGGHTRLGHITKEGNRYIRWALVEAACKSPSKDYRLGCFYRRLAARRGPLKARVAVARKLLVAVWHVLTRYEPYMATKSPTV